MQEIGFRAVAAMTKSREAGSRSRQNSSGAMAKNRCGGEALASTPSASAISVSRYGPIAPQPMSSPLRRAGAGQHFACSTGWSGGSRNTALLMSALPLASGWRPQIVGAVNRPRPQRDDVGVDPAELGPRQHFVAEAVGEGRGRNRAADAVARDEARVRADFARVPAPSTPGRRSDAGIIRIKRQRRAARGERSEAGGDEPGQRTVPEGRECRQRMRASKLRPSSSQSENRVSVASSPSETYSQ